jgi:hypothetical protein
MSKYLRAKLAAAVELLALTGCWNKVEDDPIAQRAMSEGIRIINALERYRLAKGSYPDSLDRMTPGYLSAPVPQDRLVE